MIAYSIPGVLLPLLSVLGLAGNGTAAWVLRSPGLDMKVPHHVTIIHPLYIYARLHFVTFC